MRRVERQAAAMMVMFAVGAAGCGDDGAADTSGSDVTDTASADTSAPDGLGDTGVDDTAIGVDTVDAADTSTTDATDALDTTATDTTLDTSSDVLDTTPPDTNPTDTASDAIADTSPDVAAPCDRLAPGHARHVVLSYPYGASGDPANTWKVFPLMADGTLGAPTDTLTMGLAYHGRVAFTSDGRLGFAAQEDGTLGVIAFDPDGRAKVLATHLDPGVYASAVHVDGDRLLLVNPNWAESGGGIYAASLDCDGDVGPATRLYTAKNAVDLALGNGGDHLVIARAAGTTTFGHLHQLREINGAWTRVDGVDLFGHDEAILTALAIMPDERFALIGQNSEFSDFPNEVGVARIDGAGLFAEDPIEVNDPVSIVASPHGDAALVVSGYGNAVRILAYDPASATPVRDIGEPAYIVSRPALPADAVLIGDSHPGQVLVVENVAVRRFRFDPKSKVVDLGRTAAGSGFLAIPGAIGVQP